MEKIQQLLERVQPDFTVPQGQSSMKRIRVLQEPTENRQGAKQPVVAHLALHSTTANFEAQLPRRL